MAAGDASTTADLGEVDHPGLQATTWPTQPTPAADQAEELQASMSYACLCYDFVIEAVLMGLLCLEAVLMGLICIEAFLMGLLCLEAVLMGLLCLRPF